ncbi:hypothetical protein ABT160_25925 [Streptomyces sp. NPDC001941]
MSSARPRCPACGWHPPHRRRHAARRAALDHACHPAATTRKGALR